MFSNSWGFPPETSDTPTWSALKAAIQGVTTKGALVVFAAGASKLPLTSINMRHSA